MKKSIISLILSLITLSIMTGAFIFWMIKKPNHAKLINVCVSEAKKKAIKSDLLKFDYEHSFVLDTSNPDVWIVDVLASQDISHGAISCRIFRREGNLEVSKFMVISDN